MAGTFNADQIVVGGTATAYVAPVGTALPAAEDEALDAAFKSLGYTTEAGVKFNLETDSDGLMVHQSFYEVRRVIKSRKASIAFDLTEFDAKTIPFALGGGTISEPSPDQFKYTPPSPETVDERTMVLDIQDGTTILRFVIERGMVSNTVTTTFSRSEMALLPIEFSALAAATPGTQPWFWLSNAVGFDSVTAGG